MKPHARTHARTSERTNGRTHARTSGRERAWSRTQTLGVARTDTLSADSNLCSGMQPRTQRQMYKHAQTSLLTPACTFE
eukprot:3108105-Pleurochrysis_carterae.AAC.1